MLDCVPRPLTTQGVDIAVIHDMVVTEHHYVLLVGPINLQPVKFGTQVGRRGAGCERVIGRGGAGRWQTFRGFQKRA